MTFVTFYLTNKIETAIITHDAETQGLSLSPNQYEQRNYLDIIPITAALLRNPRKLNDNNQIKLNSIEMIPFFIGIDHIGENGSNIRTSADDKKHNNKETLEIEESGLRKVQRDLARILPFMSVDLFRVFFVLKIFFDVIFQRLSKNLITTS